MLELLGELSCKRPGLLRPAKPVIVSHHIDDHIVVAREAYRYGLHRVVGEDLVALVQHLLCPLRLAFTKEHVGSTDEEIPV